MSIPKDPKQAEEYKKRLSQSLTGRKLSDEHKKKIGEANKRYNSKEYQRNKDKILEHQRKYRNGKHRGEYLEKQRILSKKWYENNKERRYEYNRRWWKNHIKELENKAGRPKPEKCELCDSSGIICFDHNHETGEFRGWICERCNTVLGKVKEDINLLNLLISYLNSHK